MSNKIYYIILLSVIFLSCSDSDDLLYNQDKDGIQFAGINGSYVSNIDFAFQYTQKADEWGYPTNYYYGDSIKSLTIKLPLSIMGWEANKEREFKIKVVDQDGYSTDLIDLEDSYKFVADKLIDTLEVTLLRPDVRGSYKVEVTFDTDYPGAEFAFGAQEKSTFTFNISDIYPKPSDWDGRAAWLGEYSEEKYAFIVTVLNIKYEYYVDWGWYNLKLRKELDKYNAANPDNPKDFTFPDNQNSIWG